MAGYAFKNLKPNSSTQWCAECVFVVCSSCEKQICSSFFFQLLLVPCNNHNECWFLGKAAYSSVKNHSDERDRRCGSSLSARFRRQHTLTSDFGRSTRCLACVRRAACGSLDFPNSWQAFQKGVSGKAGSLSHVLGTTFWVYEHKFWAYARVYSQASFDVFSGLPVISAPSLTKPIGTETGGNNEPRDAKPAYTGHKNTFFSAHRPG